SKVLTITSTPTVPTQIANNSHQIQVQFSTTNSTNMLLSNSVQYSLAQFHFHDPSEHTVDGQGFPMEEHLVYTSSTGSESVIGVFLQLGAHNSALDPILNAATANLSRPNTTTTITTPINFAGLLPTNTQGWFYEGSLTTPPVAQVVNWFVFATPITLDAAQ